MSSFDLVLKPACEGCGSPSDLYGSNCKHKTLCVSCGKKMAENQNSCDVCGTPVTRLIREYNVRSRATTDKSCFIGRFISGLPPFSKKKHAENKWTLHKDGLQGKQLTDGLREKYKNKPWLLEDETGQHQYQGQLEGAHSATYYLLVLQGKEFTAVPASSWYNFNKVAQYKQLTTDEAEEMMKRRKSSASGYERWLMKAANSGPAAFGEAKEDEKIAIGFRSKKLKSKDDEGNSEKDEEEVEVKNKQGTAGNRKGFDEDDEDEKGNDNDLDDDTEIGDDWEHEEIFTDDDEAVENDPLEREDLLAPEMPAPPEIKQDEEDEVEGEEGGLSTSGKELKKLLGKAAGLDQSDTEDDDDEDDAEDEKTTSPVLAPKHKVGVKNEPNDNSPEKTAAAGPARGTPSTSKSKKRSSTEDAMISYGTNKKETKSSVKEELSVTKPSPSSSSVTASKIGLKASEGPISVEEIRSVLLAMAPITTQQLVGHFKGRIKTQEERKGFAETMRGICKIQKVDGNSYVVLRQAK